MYWPLPLAGKSLCNYRALDIDEKFVIDWKRAATQGITTHPHPYPYPHLHPHPHLSVQTSRRP